MHEVTAQQELHDAAQIAAGVLSMAPNPTENAEVRRAQAKAADVLERYFSEVLGEESV